ncbi:hypothetical protein, partial [Methanoculleus sp. MH98A]|uniref:hypothetical protein n=1 Tax=Methanoculleus sp. MH98A TaxID=1495314 RepID=UPI001E5F8F61
GDLGQISLEGLFRKLIDEVVQQHDVIAYEKIHFGNTTFRFELKGENYFYKQEYAWVRRSDRFDSIMSIFEDVGLIRKDSDIYSITDFGTKTMRRYDSECSL